MSILNELRSPKSLHTQLLMTLAALLFFAVLATSAIAGFLVYRIVKPQRTSTDINMESFPGRPDAMKFSVPGAGERDGWFFPGFMGARTIVLCHGYGSSRGELLTLVSALQDHQYNVFVFDFAGHGANDGVTTFGYGEVVELRAAMDELAKRSDVDPQSFGLWGYNLGAYAALGEAETDKRVRALVLDSVYDQPEQMVRIGVERAGMNGLPLMTRSAEVSFDWLNHKYRHEKPLSWNMDGLAGVPKLFIAAADDTELADIALKIFKNAPEPKEEVTVLHGNFPNLGDQDKRDYENRVVSYFLLRLPPRAGKSAAEGPSTSITGQRAKSKSVRTR
jgi:pimeloyl-ACP methyl ester carboxylesterase